MSTPRRATPPLLPTLAALLLALLPPLGALFAGALTAPLWLDEVAYHYWESNSAARAAEIGRPLSVGTRLLTNYVFGDLQRLAGGLLARLGVPFAQHPEAILRALPVLCLLAAIALLFAGTLRRTGSLPRATLAALLGSSSPMFLAWGFEARGYMTAGLAAIALVFLLEEGLGAPAPETGRRWRLAAASAVTSLVLAELHQWTACLFAGLGLVFALRWWRRRRPADELLPVAAAILPGTLVLGTWWLWLRLTDPGLPRPPLFDPWTPGAALLRTFRGVVPFLVSRPRDALGLLAVVGVVSAALLVLLAGLSLWRLRSERGGLLLGGVLVALLLSVAIASSWGWLLPGRHQLFLWAAAFPFLARDRSRGVTAVAVALVALQLALLPATVDAMKYKSNGRFVAATLDRLGERSDLLVVQHPTRPGYPDPVLSFPADFYLNVAAPEKPPVEIVELPRMKNVTGLRVLSPPYLWGGRPLLAEFLQVPTPQWVDRLARSRHDRIWLLTPVPFFPSEEKVARGFEEALASAGFRKVPGNGFELAGSPEARLVLWRREERSETGRDAP